MAFNAKEYPEVKPHKWEYRASGTKNELSVYTGFHLTDEGNAGRLRAYYGDIIHYVADKREWRIYDGIRWALDTHGLIYDLASEVVKLIQAEASFVEGDSREERNAKRKAVQDWAYRSESLPRLKSMIERASTMKGIAIIAAEFDAKPELINCPNGTLDLKKREFRPHNKEDMCTKLTAVPYMPCASSEYFYRILGEALTTGEIVYFQRMLGSMLEATTKNKEYLVVYGKQYARKSSCTQPFYESLGDYAKTFPPELVQKKQGGRANEAHPELIELEGVRIAWTEELDEDFVINNSFVKSITSSGKKSTRNVYEKQRQIQLGCSFVIETNSPPIIDSKDEWQRQALLDRTRVLAFVNSVPPEERDARILRALTEDETELIVALAWGIQGYFDRVDDGLYVPEEVKQTSHDYQRRVNPLYSFVKDEVEFYRGREVVITTVKELYERFKNTADTDAIKGVKGNKSFNAHFTDIIERLAKEEGIETKVKCRHTRDGAAWTNVLLKDESDVPLEEDEFSRDCDAKCDEVTQSSAFGKVLHDIEGYYKELYQIGTFASHSCVPSPPSILVEDLEAPIFEKEGQNANIPDVTKSDAKYEGSPSPESDNGRNYPISKVISCRELIKGVLKDIEGYGLTFEADALNASIIKQSQKRDGSMPEELIKAELAKLAKGSDMAGVLNDLTGGSYFLASSDRESLTQRGSDG